MKTQIPIYRALKLGTKDEYVEGGLVVDPDRGRDYYFIARNTYMKAIEIDPSTLAIHLPDSSSTQSEKVWYNMEEISNIIKEYENGKMESN